MAQQQQSVSAATLRALTFRITSTPTKQLPKIASQIAGTIWTCRHLLSASSDSKKSSDAQTAVHRFKTQLSTLLQDRTVEGRWAAVVLIKAVIEAGGAEVLSKCNPWVRSLLAIVKKPDPPTTRILALIALTRIFTLTWHNSTLIREITTPALTAFIPTCLAIIESKRCSPAERQAILDAFVTLVPRHPTIFRTNENKLRTILSLIISSTSSHVSDGFHYTETHRSSAAKLCVLLSNCAPKSGASDKWVETLISTINAAHGTCDRIFRAVQEEWQSVAGVEPAVAHHVLSSEELEAVEDDAIGLKPWKGIHSGGERLLSILQLIRTYIASVGPGHVTLRLGSVADLLTRIFAITVPMPGLDFVKFNTQISRDEREALFIMLPDIHVEALKLTLAVIDRLGAQGHPWLHNVLEQTLWVFKAESSCVKLRSISYRLLDAILRLAGPAMPKDDVADLEQVLKTCCQALLPIDSTMYAAQNLDTSKQTNKPRIDLDLQLASKALLVTALSSIESSFIAPKIRALIDRAGVLTKDKDILVASVLNVPKKQNSHRVQPSPLPFLANEFSDRPETEALLRPRMPPILTAAHKKELEPVEQLEDLESNFDGAEEFAEHAEDATAGLLDALAQESPSNAFDTLSGERADQTVGKRRADEDGESIVAAKKIRHSPISGSRLPESDFSTQLHSTESEAVVIDHAETTAALQNLTTDQVAVRNVEETTIGAKTQQDVPSDDSDFEMPPLTMDPDTDSEDED